MSCDWLDYKTVLLGKQARPFSIVYGSAIIHSREAMSQVAVLARIFGECREGQIPRSLLRGI